MQKATVLPAAKVVVETFDWGELRWFASGALGNSNEMTIGQCRLKPGRGNPRHSHPDCEEVLHVLQGRIRHTIQNEPDVEMGPGDTISIPPNVVHNATNIGTTGDAVLMVAFSAPERRAQGE